MSLKSLNIKRNYNSSQDKIVSDFFIPLLSEAKTYKRAVGYFTAKSIASYAKGIVNLVSNDGEFQLIVSPQLNEEDIEAITRGYELKQEVIKEKIMKEICNSVLTKEELNYLNLISNLISINKLHIKIAYNPNGIYHEKIGIIIDNYGNYITFQGSLNETYSAQYKNYESFTVHFSWIEVSNEYAKDHLETFQNHWNNKTKGIEVFDFPDSLKQEFMSRYKKDKNISEVIDSIKNIEKKEIETVIEESPNKYVTDGINLPSSFKPRYYQVEAIDNWERNNYKGLLSMATGTGKTLTALYGVKKLWDSLEIKKLIVFVVVPYKILIEQWDNDIQSFNLETIKACSDYKWYQDLHNKIRSINYDIIDKFAVITTIATLKTKKMQKLIKDIKSPLLFIGDEAHNLGAYSTSKYLPIEAIFRIGLSATPKRHFDSIGTKKVEEYFSGIIYEFSLERAIREGHLVPYNYYPIVVNLTDNEMEKYNQYTEKIIKILGINDESEIFDKELPEAAKLLLIQRARVIAGASNKVPELLNVMYKYKKEKHKLIYCGATTVEDLTDDEEDVNQIDLVIKKLGQIDIWAGRYTSKENTQKRKWILKSFEDGDIDTLVAIKCLDEGVNIPQVHKAFILASSTNEKEFIQRRGRILRTHEGKESATIFDFITLPAIDSQRGLGLVIRELIRFKEFMDISKNKSKIVCLFNAICNRYGINLDKIRGDISG